MKRLQVICVVYIFLLILEKIELIRLIKQNFRDIRSLGGAINGSDILRAINLLSLSSATNLSIASLIFFKNFNSFLFCAQSTILRHISLIISSFTQRKDHPHTIYFTLDILKMFLIAFNYDVLLRKPYVAFYEKIEFRAYLKMAYTIKALTKNFRKIVFIQFVFIFLTNLIYYKLSIISYEYRNILFLSALIDLIVSKYDDNEILTLKIISVICSILNLLIILYYLIFWHRTLYCKFNSQTFYDFVMCSIYAFFNTLDLFGIRIGLRKIKIKMDTI